MQYGFTYGQAPTRFRHRVKPQLQDQNRVLYSGLDHLQVSRTVFLPITPEGVRIPGAIAPFGDKAPNCRSETNPATPPGLFAARQKNPQAILPNAPPQGDKVGGRRFFSRQDAAENGQDKAVFSRDAYFYGTGSNFRGPNMDIMR